MVKSDNSFSIEAESVRRSKMCFSLGTHLGSIG